MIEPTLNYAIKQDSIDPLKTYRSEFFHEDEKLIYLDGNSLGKLPLITASALKDTIENQWGERLIRSWNEGWYTKNKNIGKKIAQLIGAKENEVILADSTSINLYKLAFAALKYNAAKKKIISDDMNFPSDLYILQGLIKTSFPNNSLKIIKSDNGISIPKDAFIKELDKDTSLVSLSHVVFKSAFMYNIQEMNSIIQASGALDLWDLSHSVGSVPIELNKWKASLAIGCTYKYLNGGPGSPAFLYVREDLQKQLFSPITGWFGDKDPFKFDLEYTPSDEINQFLSGTPSILALSAIEPAMDILLQAGMDNIRKKSTLLSEYFISLFKEYLSPLGFTLGSPVDSSLRGSHISIRHHEAFRICTALISDKIGDYIIIPDFRKPDNIRFGFTPLYTSFEDIYLAINEIKEIVGKKFYLKIEESNQIVT